MSGHVYDCPLRLGFCGTLVTVRVLARDADHAFKVAFDVARTSSPGEMMIVTGERPRAVAGAA